MFILFTRSCQTIKLTHYIWKNHIEENSEIKDIFWTNANVYIMGTSMFPLMLANTSQLYSEKTMFDCSVIIPVYNNQEKILQAINNVKTGLLSYTTSYEIIVVNDGGPDKTLSILETARESDHNIRILSYPNNSGKGHAVKTGVLACQGS